MRLAVVLGSSELRLCAAVQTSYSEMSDPPSFRVLDKVKRSHSAESSDASQQLIRKPLVCFFSFIFYMIQSTADDHRLRTLVVFVLFWIIKR